MDNFDPLDVLKDDLKDESTSVQLEAVQQLTTVARALGPDRSLNELIPELDKYCFPVEVQAAKSSEAYSNTEALSAKEEVLAEIAENITGEFVQLLGGSAVTAQHLLPFLERLAMVEETVIRSAAVGALGAVFENMEMEDVQQYGFAVARHLADGEWFTSKISATSLVPVLYKTLNTPEDRNEVLTFHRNLCTDEMPMVKNDAYKNLVTLIEHLEPNSLLEYVKPLLTQLSQELTEEMRQTMVDIIVKLSERSDEEKSQDVVCEFSRTSVEDESWRVRKHFSDKFSVICSRLTNEHILNDMLPLYIRLLTDVEPQVRKRTLQIMEAFFATTNAQNVALELTNGTIRQLAADTVPEVREALAEQISIIGRSLSENEVRERLLPVMKKLANDESAQARLNLCSKLQDIADMLGIDLFENEILPLLREMTIDHKWRVRNSIVSNIAHIGIAMGRDRFASSRLKEILLQSLKDPASKVRATATEQVQSLNEELGFDWMQQYIFPEMVRVYDESGNYLHRMVPLKAVQLMAPSLTSDQIHDTFHDILFRSLRDDISNVRFTACRVLTVVLPRLNPPQREPFRPVLQSLINDDTDPDVKYFGAEALNEC